MCRLCKPIEESRSQMRRCKIAIKRCRHWIANNALPVARRLMCLYCTQACMLSESTLLTPCLTGASDISTDSSEPEASLSDIVETNRV